MHKEVVLNLGSDHYIKTTCFLTTFHIRSFRFRTEIDFYMSQFFLTPCFFLFLFTRLVFLNDVYSFKKIKKRLSRSLRRKNIKKISSKEGTHDKTSDLTKLGVRPFQLNDILMQLSLLAELSTDSTLILFSNGHQAYNNS